MNRASKRSRAVHRTHQRWEWAVLAGLAAGLLWVVPFGVQLIRTDWAFIEPRHQIAVWIQGREPFTLPQWSRAYGQMRHALAVSPENPVLHEHMAALLALRGQRHWQSHALRRAFFLDARRHQETSLRLRPTNGRTWAGLALSLHALQADRATLIHAIERAHRYAPHDPTVQRQLAALVLARWHEVGPAQRNWLRGLYADQGTRQRLQLDRLMRTHGVRFSASG